VRPISQLVLGVVLVRVLENIEEIEDEDDNQIGPLPRRPPFSAESKIEIGTGRGRYPVKIPLFPIHVISQLLLILRPHHGLHKSR
jgi:hypothetical protein